MLEGAMLVWFTLAALSLVFTIWDSLANAPTSWVQRMAWILVVAYTGVVGLVLYLLTCRRPFPGGHDEFTRTAWKQGVNSEMHCLAGDATGIVIAASIVPTLGLANGWDVTIEYLAGFVSGLFVFQAMMMVGMYGGDYLKAVRKTFFAETVSMNVVMAGMIPTMVILTALWPESEYPTEPAFWFRMGLATIVGGVLAYPVNYWLVASHLKHGCMTLPGRDQAAPCLGHCSLEYQGAPESTASMAPRQHQDPGDATDPAEHAEPMQHSGRMNHSNPSDSMNMPAGHEGHAMSMRELPFPTAAGIVLLTFGFLGVAVFATNWFVPIEF